MKLPIIIGLKYFPVAGDEVETSSREKDYPILRLEL